MNVLRQTMRSAHAEDLATYLARELGWRHTSWHVELLARCVDIPDDCQEPMPPPGTLWKYDPLFRQFVREKISYYQRLAVRPGERLNRCVRLIANYNHPMGWLMWRRKHGQPEEDYYWRG